jgi:transcriptional regulator with XRE-family HTH domain
MNSQKKIIGNRLREFRKQGKKTLQELANETNISHSTIARIERGELFPNLEFLAYLRNAYAINLNWLIDGVGNMFNNKDDKETTTQTKKELINLLFENIDKNLLLILEAVNDPIMRNEMANAVIYATKKFPEYFKEEQYTKLLTGG